MLIPTSLLLAASIVTTAGDSKLPEGVVKLQVRMADAALAVGAESSFTVQIELAEGWSSNQNRLSPIVQIDVPPSVQLEGRVLEDRRQLASNEYLRAPYEQIVEDGSLTVNFTLQKKPTEGEAIHVNVLAYLSQDPKVNSWFLRRRLSLPLEAGASAKVADWSQSNWGDGEILQLMDEAVSFALPRADDSLVDMEEYLYDKHILVTTYRAHW